MDPKLYFKNFVNYRQQNYVFFSGCELFSLFKLQSYKEIRDKIKTDSGNQF
jgi:hypothetical protein